MTAQGRHAARVNIAAALLLLSSATAQAQQRMPRGFVALSDIDPSIRQDLRYAGRDNFTGQPLPGYARGACWLYRAAALALKRVQADVAARGLSLKVYDCHRPVRAVAAMVRWAAGPERADTRRFYPALDKQRLLALGYIASPSAHSRGVAVDLTLVPRDASAGAPYDPTARYGPCTAERNARAPDDSIDMGTGFDCFNSKSRTQAAGLTMQQHANRMLLLNAMKRRGFHNYAREWWHFTYPAADVRQRYLLPNFDWTKATCISSGTLPRGPYRQALNYSARVIQSAHQDSVLTCVNAAIPRSDRKPSRASPRLPDIPTMRRITC